MLAVIFLLLDVILAMLVIFGIVSGPAFAIFFLAGVVLVTLVESLSV